MSFEFRVPILPRPSFFSNVKLTALSLAKLGSDYAAAPIRVSVGEGPNRDSVATANIWSDAYPVEWQMVPREANDAEFSSGLDRYAKPAGSDVIILIDADTCLMRPIDELLENLRVAGRPTVAGMQAHFPPFPDRSTSEAQWRLLLAEFGFSEAVLDRSYSMSSPVESGHCPPYFNYGFVAFNAAAFERIRPLMAGYTQKLLTQLAGIQSIYFTAQLALTLAILEADVDVLELGPEYNCPNSDEMLTHGLRSVADIRVLHYLRNNVFNRHTFLCERQEFEAFRGTKFASSVVQAFQAHVLSLRDVFLDGPLPYEPGA
ncbi:hypothetical protein C7U61_18515 [Rhizobium sp. JAB6]|uniref:hypothetical protein n=1 Tax=Rhizobium sp. JAB6 TaxID=2127050 RepID=UPI000D13607B|nr:hypothetical protein [Rhizobium sp. JAB6]PST17622.1 hypothetical protein C7U61_18515 [Rhizobium sp. JAB6]